jgi:hypothetical protein
VGHDFGDGDLVQGAEGRLGEVLTRVRDEHPGAPVIVVETCVSRLIGEDVRGVIRDVYGARATHVPVIEPDFQARDVAADSMVWAWLLQELPDVGPASAPRCVNLMGFGDRAFPAAAELRALLAGHGVTVQACLFPSFDALELQGFHRARVTIVNPCSQVRSAVRVAMRGMPGMRWVFPAAPFGVAATGAWLRDVLCELGFEDAAERAAREAEPWERELAARRAGATGGPVAFSCESRYSSYLFAPEEVFGIPLLDVLAEAGCPAHVHVLTSEPVPHDLRAAVARHPSTRLFEHADPGALLSSVRDEGARLLFTSLERNEVAVELGLAPIFGRTFEMGFRGALRTVDRLAQLSGLQFLDRYRDYLRQGER